MNIYSFFKRIKTYYNPRTPNSAFIGVMKGSIPKEFYIYKNNFLYTPFDKISVDDDYYEFNRIKELERLLAKDERDLELEVQLLDTLEQLALHNNPEIALFAAESINSIENSYNKEIFEIKNNNENAFSLDNIKKIVRLNYEYGYINRRKSEIKRFYYNEALEYLNLLEKYNYINRELLIYKIDLYNYFKEFDKSRKLLKEYSDVLSYDLQINLKCEIEFKDCNYGEVIATIKRVDKKLISREFLERLELWVND